MLFSSFDPISSNFVNTNHLVVICGLASSYFKVCCFHQNLFEFFQEDRFAFLAEWFDPAAGLLRRFQLFFYPKDGSVEMVLYSCNKHP